MLAGENEIRKVIPDFDLLMIDEMRSLFIEFSYRQESEHKYQSANLVIKFTYLNKGVTYVITLELEGVSKLKFPELGTYMFELGELGIFSITDRNMPGLNYCVDDTLDGMFCYCRDVAFVDITREEESGQHVAIWSRAITDKRGQV